MVRYRIRSADVREATAWFDLPISTWADDAGALAVDGTADRLVPGSVSRFGAPGRERTRVRFALRLEPGEHVVGLGERFHALDQRGRAIDATVFEQYTNQGERTYLPVPFAHVVGGDGWGFHVDTTRRVWFDIGAAEPDRIWVEVHGPDAVLHLWSGEPAAVLAEFFGVGRCARAHPRVGVPAVGELERVEHPRAGRSRGGAQHRGGCADRHGGDRGVERRGHDPHLARRTVRAPAGRVAAALR